MGHMQDLQLAGSGLATDDAMQASMRVIDKLREDVDFWRRAEAVQVALVAALKALADLQAKELAELTVAVANLKASNIKLRQALPVVDIEHARKVMAEDLAKDWGDDDQCTVCNGTGEGQHEGAACSTCGGKG